MNIFAMSLVLFGMICTGIGINLFAKGRSRIYCVHTEVRYIREDTDIVQYLSCRHEPSYIITGKTLNEVEILKEITQ